MSEPAGKLENWCQKLIQAYLADRDTEGGSVAKGLFDGKLAASQPPTHTLASAQERAREDEEEGHAGEAAEAEGAVEEAVTPSLELVQLIEKVQPPTPPSGESLVPTSLPREVKTKIYSVTREEFSRMYKLDAAIARVQEHTVSPCELICMYLKSFRNILYYELCELHSHRQYFDRIQGYCAHVLQDLVEELFPGQNFTDIVSIH